MYDKPVTSLKVAQCLNDFIQEAQMIQHYLSPETPCWSQGRKPAGPVAPAGGQGNNDTKRAGVSGAPAAPVLPRG